MLIDSHTHVQFPEFDADRDAVIRRALDAGIWMVNVGTNVESSKKAVELAHQYPKGVYPVRKKSLQATEVAPYGAAFSNGVYATVGIHPVRDFISNGASPHDADSEYNFARIEELARDPKVVGIGETGLDYAIFVREQSKRVQKRASAEAKSKGGLPQEEIKQRKEKQKELFIKHIELARKVGKPLIIHCRNAHSDLLEILRDQYGEVQPPTTNNFLSSGRHTATNNSKVGDSQRAEVEPRSAGGGRTSGTDVEPRGVMHFFGGAGAWENLDEYLKMGFYISLAGVITFSNYKNAENVEKIPLDRILIETDAPYVAPEPFRGKRNEPLYVKYAAEKIAKIRNISLEKAAEQTSLNAKKLFNIYFELRNSATPLFYKHI